MATKTANREKSEILERGNDVLREQALTVGREVRELAATAGAAACAKVDPLAEYVREKPLKALLVAAGVGALCGVVFFRR
jgi:ElaB/YqjD/DUF883 family membrane-anchored ribosome-binding protein